MSEKLAFLAGEKRIDFTVVLWYIDDVKLLI
jgi:hypothetical protein